MEVSNKFTSFYRGYYGCAEDIPRRGTPFEAVTSCSGDYLQAGCQEASGVEVSNCLQINVCLLFQLKQHRHS